MLERAELRQRRKKHKNTKKIGVCHNLATWRCIFAAQLKNTSMKKDLKATDVTKLLQVQLIDEIIVRMQDKKLSEESIKKAKPFIVEFAKRNNISENAAMLFAAFFNDFADHQIWIRDIAGFFECNKVKILTMWSAIEELVSRRFILQYKKDCGDLYFTVPNEVVAAMREDRIYSPSANAKVLWIRKCDSQSVRTMSARLRLLRRSSWRMRLLVSWQRLRMMNTWLSLRESWICLSGTTTITSSEKISKISWKHVGKCVCMRDYWKEEYIRYRLLVLLNRQIATDR